MLSDDDIEIRVGRIPDGRWCAVASLDRDGTVVVLTVGSGSTRAEALADCKNDMPAAIRAYEHEESRC